MELSSAIRKKDMVLGESWMQLERTVLLESANPRKPNARASSHLWFLSPHAIDLYVYVYVYMRHESRNEITRGQRD